MKFLRWLVIPFLAIGLAAQTSGQTTTKTTSKRTTKTVTKRHRAAAAPAAVTQADIQSLRDALAAQQQQIQQLSEAFKQKDQVWQQAQQQLSQAQSSATDAQTKASAAEQASTQNAATVTQLQSDVKDVKSNATNAAVTTQEEQKKLAGLEGRLNRFRWTGDVRVRGESFFQNGVADRNRARIRVRLGVEGRPNEDFLAGAFLATGTVVNGAPSFTNPLTTNETLTSNFEKKTIGLDRGYIIYNPQAAKWLKLTGGKFAYDWVRTDMTFDPDLNPEGFTERASFDFKNSFFKNVYLQGMELLFNEVPGGSLSAVPPNLGVDSNALGATFGAKLALVSWWASTPSFTILNWNGADEIAQASLPVGLCASGSTKNCILQPNTPAAGKPLPNPVIAALVTLNGNPMTNATRITGTGTGQKRVFVSGFEYADFIWDNVFQTPWKRFPWRVTAEYEQNLRARLNVGAPSKQDKAYWLDTAFGQQKQKHDFQVGYSWWRVEQDAVISQFVQDDQRAPTNNLQNRFYANWLIQANTTASLTYYLGHTLNQNLQNAALAPGLKKGLSDPYLNRLQLDVVYKF